MAHIHFIGDEKGGVGKSLVARILAQYLIDHERPFPGFDTDPSHGALMRFYAGYASPVVVDRYESLDATLDASGEKKRALELHARIINIKRLHEASMIRIDSHSSSFWSATQSSDAHALGILDRQRVKMWINNTYSEIETLHV
jgi:cellulose biosynthesis protein BcsQ